MNSQFPVCWFNLKSCTAVEQHALVVKNCKYEQVYVCGRHRNYGADVAAGPGTRFRSKHGYKSGVCNTAGAQWDFTTNHCEYRVESAGLGMGQVMVPTAEYRGPEGSVLQGVMWDTNRICIRNVRKKPDTVASSSLPAGSMYIAPVGNLGSVDLQQAKDDYEQLRAHMHTELRRNIQMQVEQQLIYGNHGKVSDIIKNFNPGV